MREFPTSGIQLRGQAYQDHFANHFWQTGPTGFWKVERLQHFQEPGDGSWSAFDNGHWTEALHQLEQRRTALTAHYARIRDHGFETWRIRIVEQPLTPYMQWELHLLRLRDELGGHTRILHAHDIAADETHGPLPEIIALGDTGLYKLVYDDTGLQQGGDYHADPTLVAQWRHHIQDLYGRGEPIQTYFNREIASMGQPCSD